MVNHLPDLIDPLEFVEKKRRIKGSVPFSRMERVFDVLSNREGEADVELQFKREGKVAVIVGRVNADLSLQCQCCLEILSWPVHSEVRLGVVGSLDEADLLPEQFEPLVVEPGVSIAVKNIVQDELLLAIPSIPQHTECHLPKAQVALDSAGHPFAALAQLKKTNQ